MNKNNAHGRIKMKPSVKWSIYNDFDVENNDKNPIFQVGDHVRILKYSKSFLQKVTLQIRQKIILSLKKSNTLYCGLL